MQDKRGHWLRRLLRARVSARVSARVRVRVGVRARVRVGARVGARAGVEHHLVHHQFDPLDPCELVLALWLGLELAVLCRLLGHLLRVRVRLRAGGGVRVGANMVALTLLGHRLQLLEAGARLADEKGAGTPRLVEALVRVRARVGVRVS